MFSVIITTFNREKFLKRAVQSIYQQSILPSELLIINNGEKKYHFKDLIINSKKKLKLKIINNKKNLYQSKARNLGANLAKSKYICFLDDDDIWNKEYLENTKKIINNKNPDIILSKIYRKKKLFKNPDNLTLNNILIKNPGVTGSNIIIKRKIFLEIKGFSKKLEPSEDKGLIVEALLKKKSIIVSNNKVFFSSHYGERLTKNYVKLSNGVFSFYNKYKYLMSFKQRIFVLKRIFNYRIKSKKYYYLPVYLILFFINKIIN